MYTYDKVVLPNGLRVVFLHMPHVQSTVTAAYVGMGSRYEPPETEGLSHLLEHMLFRGARGYADSIDLLGAIADIGGAADAFTSPEYAAFLMSSHARRAGQAFKLLADVLLGADLREDDLDVERNIVLAELEDFKAADGDYVSIEDIAYGLMWKVDQQPSLALGSQRILDSFTVKALREHYQTFFVPSNIVLCVAGRFDRDEMADAVARELGPLAGEQPELRADIVDDRGGPKCMFVPCPSPAVQVKLCHKAFSYRHPQLVTVLLIADVLGGGVSSRLMSRVRESAGLVYDISCHPSLFGDVGSVDIHTRCDSKSMAEIVRISLEELDRLLSEGVSEQELRRSEETAFTHTHFILDSPLDLATWFGVEELLIRPGKPETPEEQAEKIRDVSREQLLAVAREIFAPEGRNFVALGRAGWLQRRRARKLLGV